MGSSRESSRRQYRKRIHTRIVDSFTVALPEKLFVGPISILTIRLFPTLSYVVYHLKPTTVLRTSSTCRTITTYHELAEGKDGQ